MSQLIFSPVVIIGAGGHSVSVVDSALAAGLEVAGFIDEKKTGQHLGRPIFGSRVSDVPEYKEYNYHIAIGNCPTRRRWFTELRRRGLPLINIIDPTAIVSEEVVMGTGNYIGKLAVVIAGSTIGDNNIINTKALVEHECRVGNHTNLSTNSIINGDVVVEDGVFLGSSSLCNGQLTLGHDSIIGSGSVVIRSVDPMTTVVGAPARVIKRNGEVI